MIYTVKGADKETGEDTTMLAEADTATIAKEKVSKHMLVENALPATLDNKLTYELLMTLRQIRDNTTSIRSWVTFIGLLFAIPLILALIILVIWLIAVVLIHH